MLGFKQRDTSMIELGDGQQALIEAAAAKAAQKIRPKSAHKDSIVPNSRPTPAATSDPELTLVRPHAARGHRGDPDSDNENERLLSAAQVKRRYGNASDMWLWRRLHDSSGFPHPLLICPRRFWKLSALVAWEGASAKVPGQDDRRTGSVGLRKNPR
jgi:hypothetical protein